MDGRSRRGLLDKYANRHAAREAGTGQVVGAAQRAGSTGGLDTPGRRCARPWHDDRAAGGSAIRGAARRLNCPEDEVGVRLAPVTDTTGDLVYIDDFGLYTAVLLGQAHTLQTWPTLPGTLALLVRWRGVKPTLGEGSPRGKHRRIGTGEGASVAAFEKKARKRSVSVVSPCSSWPG
jgi:hypothetical protein